MPPASASTPSDLAAPESAARGLEAAPRPPEREALEFYHVLRGQLEHEDNLITNRTSWFLSSQSFLFSAYAIIANGYVSTPRATPPIVNLASAANSTDPRRLLLVIIPGVSVIVCLLTLVSILSGVAALHTLRRFYDNSPLCCQTSALPPVQGYRSTRVAGVAAPVMLPLLFVGVWVFLLLRRLF
jgi:hypothetical protein